ncbi:MAG TPA: hypothetical protein VE944_22835 [Nostoc sp.]|uniref:hypothetical protein n=1 Tax=Nostoc sp. TaxID=1180 RepID=UPI002D5E9374|nr:hypothetical protein [Nostoc sp.]HYX17131.1 hypothetical protein [Nostoc sp.]
MTNILLEDIDVSLWEELDDVSASKISGGEGIGAEVAAANSFAREEGFQNANKLTRELNSTNFGQSVSEFAQFVNGPSPTVPV